MINTMGQAGDGFEKGEADGTRDALRVLRRDAVARCVSLKSPLPAEAAIDEPATRGTHDLVVHALDLHAVALLVANAGGGGGRGHAGEAGETGDEGGGEKESELLHGAAGPQKVEHGRRRAG